MNRRAAYLHLFSFSDAVPSIGVILGGLTILFYDIHRSILCSRCRSASTCPKKAWRFSGAPWGLFMLAVPPTLSLAEIRNAIGQLPQVRGVHHLHLWQAPEQDVHFEGHIELGDRPLSEADCVRTWIETLLREQFGIGHITVQLETREGNYSTSHLS